MRREEIELLAPAGSYEGFEAAIGAGADAVYVGGAAFGARAYAKNFGEEELLRRHCAYSWEEVVFDSKYASKEQRTFRTAL